MSQYDPMQFRFTLNYSGTYGQRYFYMEFPRVVGEDEADDIRKFVEIALRRLPAASEGHEDE